MTFMPSFIQPVEEPSNESQINLEADLLKERSRKSLAELRVKLSAPESVYSIRLEAELRILEDHGFCGYYLIVADYVSWARENGIAVGPGRGSGPWSLVGYVLGITNIDPIAYELPFERFVNPERESIPDFDLDFCNKRRDEITRYLQLKYGSERVAQISSDDARPLPSRLIICDRPLSELVSIYPNPESGFPTAGVNIAHIGSSGFVQFNAINQKALTAIQRTVQSIANSGNVIDINHVALDDYHAYHHLSAGRVSIFSLFDEKQFNAALITVKPTCFKELYAVIAMCYPRLRGNIPVYAERIRNTATIQHFHPAIESVTEETYGLIIYQEQVMQITQKVAGFSMAQADSFRRALRKSNRETIGEYKRNFIAGATNFGLPRNESIALFEQLAISEKCTFNKSHAVAYGILVYQLAWLQANYPDEFTS